MRLIGKPDPIRKDRTMAQFTVIVVETVTIAPGLLTKVYLKAIVTIHSAAESKESVLRDLDITNDLFAGIGGPDGPIVVYTRINWTGIDLTATFARYDAAWIPALCQRIADVLDTPPIAACYQNTPIAPKTNRQLTRPDNLVSIAQPGERRPAVSPVED